jgi:pantoate--beta-alanine ligase
MNAQLIHSVAEARQALAAVRRSETILGLVPTMGALHAGHGRLIEAAVRECGYVVVSIFVNPIQFNDQRDYALYPQTLSTDIEFCQARGAHAVFAPSAAEMYPHPQSSFVEVAGVSERLCGEFRPGHFRGVATVVLKLFNIVQPDRAYFGEKDAQQLAVIRRMVRDLNVPVQVVGVPTVREPDGLALSSRNQRLSREERLIAPALYRALDIAAKRIAMGEPQPEKVKLEALAELNRPEIRVEYFEIADPAEMQPAGRIEGPVLVAAAIWIGSTRLIDNLACSPLGDELGAIRERCSRLPVQDARTAEEILGYDESGLPH